MANFSYPQTATQILGFRASAAPNPGCCSNPAMLCPRCAGQALTLNCEGHEHRDDLPMLLPPTGEQYGMTEQYSDQPSITYNNDPNLLIPPTINWGSQPRPHGRPTRSNQFDEAGNQLLLPPSMHF